MGSAELIGVVGGDTVNLETGSAIGTFDSKDAGSGKVVAVSGLSLRGGNAGNSSLRQPAHTADITVKEVTVSGITANNKVYDGNTSATLELGSAELIGAVGGDTVNLETGSAIGTFDSKDAGSGKVVAVSGLSLSGSDAGNYSLVQPATTADITVKEVTVSGITANNKVYDGNTAATLELGSAELIGAVGGDTVNLETGSAVGTFDSKDAGSGKVVTISGLSLSGSDAGNYSLTQPATTADITVKEVTVSGITADNKVYDGNTSATLELGSAELIGVVGGDTVNLETGSAT